MVRGAGQIDFIVADLDKFTRLEVVTLAQNINANLRDAPPLGTPIDVGWASANWMPSVGEPRIVSGLPANSREGPTPAEVAARSQESSDGLNSVLSWQHGDGALFSTNNVPYIGRLNDGHSTQSPRGFVQIAIEKAIQQTETGAGKRAAFRRRAAAARSKKARPRR